MRVRRRELLRPCRRHLGPRLVSCGRADAAGIKDFHQHRLRPTGASRLDAGGSEGGLMIVAGWSSRDMLARYVQDTAMERAAEESRRAG